MSVGQFEKKTQDRVIALFRDRLDYRYLGDLSDRDNKNIDQYTLTNWLTKTKVSPELINKALYELDKAAKDTSKKLYDRNKNVYSLLRYGVKIKPTVGENNITIELIDWKNPENNDFAIAEEVTVKGANAKANTKRPDIVIYINGIALGILELKRSTVSVSEGIRQNLDNQEKRFIQPFFSTVQWIMAGNDTEGLRYATIETPSKYYLTWFEESGPYANEPNLLDRHLLQICNKPRFLELIHDFVMFDAGTKKICRQQQYFGIKAAQEFIRRREGGIIWHTQGSGKSLTMVWLAKWILEHDNESRVLIITDRDELDKQIKKVFVGVGEKIYHTKSGSDLIEKLNIIGDRLLCSLVHKFGRQENGETDDDEKTQSFVESMRKLPPNFKAKGDIYVFVDECHRTQSGELHKAMKMLLPNALFIGFTGTPLLKADKKKSMEVFGRYIHTYRFDQAVREGVVLDLRYEARNIDQKLTNTDKIDEWFESKTRALNDVAKSQLKKKWGTMQRVLSSQGRLAKIYLDIMFDMSTKPRLESGRGNALLVAGSIYEACKFYKLFSESELKGKCAIVTSYSPNIDNIKGETTGEGESDGLVKYEIYCQMLADWFDEPPETAIKKVKTFEDEVKKKFEEEPGQMKLLIVVDKLLTGFDAPPATYLYIDKQMRDHGLFQAICRVNRLDGDDKDYGYIVDYKDLFKSLEGAVADYTHGALDGYESEDVAGLLKDRLDSGREDLEAALDAVKAWCEPVELPRDQLAYKRYFCTQDLGNVEQLKENESKRLKLYKLVAALIRKYANIANELAEAGYTPDQIKKIKQEVDHYTNVRNEVKLASGDYIDLKGYEPAMRHLIDNYIQAEDSEILSSFGGLSLTQLIVERGTDAIKALPKRLRENDEVLAETITNNVRKIITDESPIDPAYYEKISKLLDTLIEKRRKGAMDYKEYLQQIAELTKQAANRGGNMDSYPEAIKTAAQRALYNNLGNDEDLAVELDKAIRGSLQSDWRTNNMKTKKVRLAINALLKDDILTERILELAKNQHHDY
jgi:type I restriction enzyme R subunit